MTTKRKSAGGAAKPVMVEAAKGETEPETMARVFSGPYIRHGIVTQSVLDKMVGKLPGEPKFDHFAKAIKIQADSAVKGDLSVASEMLMAQAMSLDALFTEFARRAALNMGDYINASERYARVALKAQSNSRATLETLARLHQPREQTVRHVHVNEGGQAVIADEFHHHHGGAGENGKSNEQSLAAGAAGHGPALPRPDPLGNGVPIASGEREASMQDARRD